MNGLSTGESDFITKVDFTKNQFTMKIKVYITSLLFFLVGMKINAQNEIHIDTISFYYFNGITKQAQNINEIQVTNNSSEDYLTWISLMPINKKSNNDLIYDFFKKKKG